MPGISHWKVDSCSEIHCLFMCIWIKKIGITNTTAFGLGYQPNCYIRVWPFFLFFLFQISLIWIERPCSILTQSGKNINIDFPSCIHNVAAELSYSWDAYIWDSNNRSNNIRTDVTKHTELMKPSVLETNQYSSITITLSLFFHANQSHYVILSSFSCE